VEPATSESQVRHPNHYTPRQWWMEKFVLGGGRIGGLGAVHPAGVQGAESPLRIWGTKSPRSCSINAFCVMSKALS